MMKCKDESKPHHISQPEIIEQLGWDQLSKTTKTNFLQETHAMVVSGRTIWAKGRVVPTFFKVQPGST